LKALAVPATGKSTDSSCTADKSSQLCRTVSAKSYTNPHAIFCQKIDPTLLESVLYRLQCGLPWMDGIVLDHVQGHGREAGPVREGCLGPFQQAARRADLGGADHGDTLYPKLEEI
jgi:hypothetical protein